MSTDWPHAPPHRLGSDHSYFVTAATYRKEHHFRSRQRLDVLQRGILKLTAKHDWQLTAWAVFSNHYHFIARPPSGRDGASLKPLIAKLHEKTAKWLNKLDEAPGRMIWHNYRDTILSFEKSYYARLKYVHHNAVHHSLVAKAEDYRWCSAAWFARTADPSFRKTIESFKIDRVNVPDDFHPQLPAS